MPLVRVTVDEETKARWESAALREGCALAELVRRVVDASIEPLYAGAAGGGKRARRRPPARACSDLRGAHARARAGAGWQWCPECAAKVSG